MPPLVERNKLICSIPPYTTPFPCAFVIGDLPQLLLPRSCLCKSLGSYAERAAYSGAREANDFLEARIAAQRIPQRTQAQVAVSVVARSFDEGFKLLKRQFAFACPGADDGEANLYVWLSV